MSRRRIGFRLGLAVFTTLCSVFVATTFAQQDPVKRYALLVGVNEYEHANFPNLKFAENDAKELGAFLRTTGYQVTVLTSKDAALAGVRAELTKLLKGRKRGDLVLVGLAGHGLQFNDREKKEENGNYFCTTDAEPKDPKTMLPLSEVYEQLADCGAAARFLLVDACRNEGARGLRRGIDTPHQTPAGVGALFSCSAGQFSFESPDLKHGVFFYHVLEALKGKTKEDDGEVTWDGLRAYVKRQVSKDVPKLFADARQEPNDVGNLAALPPLVRLANVAVPEKKAPSFEQTAKLPIKPTIPPQALNPPTQSSKNRKALLVGVGEYQHQKLPPLAYTENDVVELAQVLRQADYQVVLLSDGAGRQQPRYAPTKVNIERELKVLSEECRRKDTLLVAFAGHGLQFAEQRDAFLCPADALPFANETESMVSLGKVYDQLERSFAGVKVLLVDACRDDPRPSRGINADSAPPPPRGVAALFSCSAGERAFDVPKFQHGIFFHYVIDGLRGKAKNLDGDVTFASLADYVQSRVSREVPKVIGDGAKQSPNMKADLSGASPVLTGR